MKNDDLFKKLLNEIKWLDADMHGKDFLLTWEKSINELKQVLYTAEALKYLHDNNISVRCFDSGMAVSQFRNESSWTRFSFAFAANLLGLTFYDMDESKSRVDHGKTDRESVSKIFFLTDIIGICDFMYMGEGSTYMKKVGKALDEGFEKGFLPQRPGIINLQSDIDHPNQTLADLLYMKNHFGSLEKLRGKKIAVTWAYSPCRGKPLSITQGIICLMTRFGMNITLAHPESYYLLPDVIDIAKKNAAENGGKFEIVHSMDEAFVESDVVFSRNWAPYPLMEKRTTLPGYYDHIGLQKLEQECIDQNINYKGWKCSEEKIKLTKEGEALYMSSLPTDISTYKKIGYKPYIIASIMLNNLSQNPAKILETLKKRKTKRIGT